MKHIIYSLFWLILIVPASAQDTRQAPYLYYFANDLNAFIIERADGTDSRIFAENIMPTETISVHGAGWSPSGNWFAWTAVQGLDTDLLQTGYVISRDETTSYELLKTGQPHVRAMLWSPREDFLLVGYQDSPLHFPLHPHFELLDVATQTEIFSFDLPSNISNLNIHWFNEGMGIVLTYELYNGHSFAGRYLRRMTLDGEMQEFEIGFSHGGVTDTNWIAYSNPENTSLMLWNLVDNVERHLDLPEGKYHWGQWDFRGEYYAFQLEQNCRNPLACLSDLWMVTPTSHEPYLVAGNIYYHGRQVSAWSPDTQIIVYTTTGAFGYYRADMNASELIIIPDERDYAIANFSWVNDGIMYVWVTGAGNIYRYAIRDNGLSVLQLGYDAYEWLRVPNDGIVIIRVGQHFELRKVMNDLITPIAFHTEALWADYMDVRMHDSGEWLITIENVPSDYYSDRAYGVVSIDGEIRREFGVCRFRPSTICADWLPSQVEM